MSTTGIRERVLGYMHNIGEPCDAKLIHERTSTGYPTERIDTCLRAMERDGYVREAVADLYVLTAKGLRLLNVGPEDAGQSNAEPPKEPAAEKAAPDKKPTPKKAPAKKKGGDDIAPAEDKPTKVLVIAGNDIARQLKETVERLEREGFEVQEIDRKILTLDQLQSITAPDISEVLSKIRADYIRFDELNP